MNLNHLRYLLHAVEHGSIHVAAKSLSVSQPAISNGVRRLEREIGKPLLSRSSRGVVATVFGEVLCLYAKIALQAIDNAETEIDFVRRGSKGHIALGTGRGLAAEFMPGIISDLESSSPGTTLTVFEDSYVALLPRLQSGELDILLTDYPEDVTRLTDVDVEPLTTARVSVLARKRHPLARASSVSPEELRRYAWLGMDATGVQTVASALLGSGTPSGTAGWVRTDSLSLLLSSLLSDDFLAIAPEHVLGKLLAKGDICRLNVRGPKVDVRVGVLKRHNRPLSPATRQLLKLVRVHFTKYESRMTSEKLSKR